MMVEGETASPERKSGGPLASEGPTLSGNCPSPAEFADYLAGNSAGERPAGIAEHLGNCPECRLKEMAFRTAIMTYLASATGPARRRGTGKSTPQRRPTRRD